MKKFIIGMAVLNFSFAVMYILVWIFASIIFWEVQPIIGVNSFAYNNPLRVFVTTEFIFAVIVGVVLIGK